MKWPWVSRKRFERTLAENGESTRYEIERRDAMLADARKEFDRLRGHNTSLQRVVGTLRAESAEHRRAITDLLAENADLRQKAQADASTKPVPTQQKPQPRLGNFIRTRDILESAGRNDLPIKEREDKIEPDKEAVTNGQR